MEDNISVVSYEIYGENLDPTMNLDLMYNNVTGGYKLVPAPIVKVEVGSQTPKKKKAGKPMTEVIMIIINIFRTNIYLSRSTEQLITRE